jgi:hypothetical protein
MNVSLMHRKSIPEPFILAAQRGSIVFKKTKREGGRVKEGA